jgi:heme/copper-type cytochrome/quinol oxidase subunit 2
MWLGPYWLPCTPQPCLWCSTLSWWQWTGPTATDSGPSRSWPHAAAAHHHHLLLLLLVVMVVVAVMVLLAAVVGLLQRVQRDRPRQQGWGVRAQQARDHSSRS